MSSRIVIPFIAAVLISSVGCQGMFVPKDQYDNDIAFLKKEKSALERDNAEMRAKADAFDRLAAHKGLTEGAAADYAAIAEALKKALAGLALEDDDVTFNAKDGVYTLKGDLLFDKGKWEISPKGKEILKRIAQSNRSGHFRIVGHTDKTPVVSVGLKKELRTDSNLELSTNRATAVAGEFMQSGIPERHMEVVGKGATELKRSDKDSRRVEIYLVGTGKTSMK